MSPLSGTSLPVHSHYSLVVVREAPVQYQYSVDHMTICTYIRNFFCATVTVITMFVLWREYHKLTLITKSLRKFVDCLCSLSRLKKICFYIHVKYLKSCELLKYQFLSIIQVWNITYLALFSWLTPSQG